ncbi:hypothetical protein ACLMJK_003455 [Lecanora helva]
MPSPISHLLAAILSAELLLGGQARLPISPTPSLQKRAMAKADGTLAAFPFVPLDAVTFTRVIGVAMCLASVGVAVPATRAAGVMLSGTLSLMGVWNQDIWYASNYKEAAKGVKKQRPNYKSMGPNVRCLQNAGLIEHSIPAYDHGLNENPHVRFAECLNAGNGFEKDTTEDGRREFKQAEKDLTTDTSIEPQES